MLSVLIYHAHNNWLGGGFAGVDIFFVISGYLITGILAREIDAGLNSIVAFYCRRIRRLFPALLLMLAAVIGLGWFLLEPADFVELGRTTVSTMLFVSNFDFWSLTGYFGGDAEMKPLLHTWSLAVEEQFYIVFPVLCALLFRFGRGVTIAVLGILAAASLAYSAWLAMAAPSAAFYLAPSRAFELLIGALIALVATPQMSGRVRGALSKLGLALVVLSVALLSDETPFPGFAALVPSLGAGLMIFAGKDGPTQAGAWISNPVLVFFGAISYSLYLWHWPLLVFARHWSFGEMPPLVVAGAVALSIAAAYFSYHFVEQPFLRGKPSAPTVLAIGAAAMAAGVAAGAALVLTDGLPQRFSAEALTLFASADEFNPRREQCHHGDGEERIARYEDNCRFGAQAAPSVAVWGDSNGAELVVALGERLAAYGASAMQLTANSCPPAPGYDPPARPLCRPRNAAILENLVRDERIVLVVIVANYAGYRDRYRPVIEAGLHTAISQLRGAGKRVILVGPIPIMASDPPSALGFIVARGADPASYGVTRQTHDERNTWANSLLDGFRRDVTVVSPTEILCDEVLCRAYIQGSGRSAYFDRTHVNLSGARLIADRVPLD